MPRVKSVKAKNFRRFTDLRITDLPESAKLVVLLGPNGCGKSSLFEVFNLWGTAYLKDSFGWHESGSYYQKVPEGHDSSALQRIDVSFHEDIGERVKSNEKARKAFYVRSAYRNEASFQMKSLPQIKSALDDPHSPARMIEADSRVSDNYARIVADSIKMIYDPEQRASLAGQVSDAVIGKARKSLNRIFGDLLLEGPGNPLEEGTFYFSARIHKV